MTLFLPYAGFLFYEVASLEAIFETGGFAENGCSVGVLYEKPGKNKTGTLDVLFFPESEKLET